MPYHARILMTLGVVAALLLTLVAAAPAAPVSSTVLVDRPAGFGALPFDGVSDASIGSHALSADGRYVVFSSSNDVLLAGDEDSAVNVYRLDRSNGALAQVNVTAAGGQPLAGSVSAAASISADGRYVEFESQSSNLVTGGGPVDGFYVKDMQTGAVELASRATGPAGAAAPRPGLAVISGDGRHVAFTATGVLHADNADGAAGATDAYVRALDAGTTHMVSVGAAGGEVGGVNDRAAPDIDFNGDAVAFITTFASAASSLPGADGVRGEVYVRSAWVDVNVSQPAGAPPRTSPAGSSFLPSVHAVSDDGRKVIFQPEAPAFRSVSAFGDFRDQVVVRDLVSGKTELVSAAPDGSPANDFAFAPSLDATGSHAAFMSEATNLVGDPNPDGPVHAYVRDLASGAVTLVDRNAAGAPLADGVETISPDGRHLVYVSGSADAPGRPANDRAQHVYVVDLATGTTVLADRSGDGTPADRRSFHADISADGSRVAFESLATNLGAGVSPSAQLYVRDLAKNTTTWVSVPQDANPMHADPGELSLSRDGTRVAFEQYNPQFGFGMTGSAQVFVRDLAAASTTLASLTPGGAVAENGEQPSLSADGSRVSFTTNFDRSPLIPQVFVRDLSAATTTLVSVKRDGGGPARLGASEPSLSGNGACIAFSSRSDDLVNPGYGPDFLHVFLRGLGSGCAVGFDGGGNGGGTGAGATGSGGGGGGPKPDKTPPRITGARLTHARFTVTSARTAVVAIARTLRHPRAPRGTSFVFFLSESAQTTIAITRRADGRRSGARCVAPRPGLKRRCKRTVTVLTLTRRSRPSGRNSVPFSGRAGRTRLTPGRYVARIVARDLAGNRSKPAQLAFIVVGR